MWRIEFDAEHVLDVRKNGQARWNAVTVMLAPAAGNTCTVFVTYDLDPLAPGAAWLEWPKDGYSGAGTGTEIDSCEGPVTGVRVLRTAGTASGNKATICGGIVRGWHSSPPAKGEKGEPGADSVVPGPQGDPGPPGPSGVANIYGARMLTGQIFTGALQPGGVFGTIPYLSLPIAPNETWSFEVYLVAGCNGAAGANFSVNCATAALLQFQVFGNLAGVGAFSQGFGSFNDDSLGPFLTSNNQGRLIQFNGVVVNDTTAGIIDLRCRAVNPAQQVTVQTGYISARRHA